MTTSPDALLDELRAPLVGTDEVHLNNAGVAPMTARAERAGAEALAAMRHGSHAIGPLLKSYEQARQSFARLVDAADKNDVAFFQTCAAAISQVAFGLRLDRGDEIVLVDQEYPSNAYPWHRAAERAGGRVVVVRSRPDYSIALDDVLAAITPRTRVVACSAVQYSTGAALELAPLAEAVHAVGGWLVVDAIQALGVVPLSLRALGVDAVCGGCHKWLLGPVGHGFLALAPGRAQHLTPLLQGAMTYGTPDDVVDPTRPARGHDGASDPRRFEPGAPLFLGALAAAASVELLLGIGVERVRREALSIATLVREGAARRGYALRPSDGPIVTLVPHGGDPGAVAEQLRVRGISVAARGGGVRVSAHAHNRPQHVERLFAALDEIDRRPG